MKKLIKTAAVLLMPMAMFAQVDGPHSHDRDSITISSCLLYTSDAADE